MTTHAQAHELDFTTATHIRKPSLLITDTVPNRSPHDHNPTDTPDKLNYGAMARVVQGLCSVINNLAVEYARTTPIAR